MNTEQHLKAWCKAQFEHNWERVFAVMSGKLDVLDDADYAYALAGGWWKFYDSIPELKSISQGR